ncbi:MAG TPA: AtpZ/AtpI family protein [Gemmatimonadaceae bacterium]|nr:AtpZ/AtpI family protein [Gemmatimonadaceae bacterium]
MSGDRHTPTGGHLGDSHDARLARAAGRYAGVGLQFAASIVAFLYAGQWLDRRFGTAPWGVLAGVFIGASAAFYSMYRRLMADLRRQEQEQATERARERAQEGTRQ